MNTQNENREIDNILIVDDNPQNIQLVAAALKDEGYKLSFAQSDQGALQKINSTLFDLILLDIMMPEMDGYEVCSKILENPEFREIPIIFLTAKADKESIVEGLRTGGADYVVKPFHGDELRARVKIHLSNKQYRERLEEINITLNKEILKSIKMEEELQNSREELQRINRELYKRATEDQLTGLMNRRKMLDHIEYEQERFQRNKKTLSIIITDIDKFKKVNDTYGHNCGDLVLKKAAEMLYSNKRKQDLLARWGGEEFLLVLPETDQEEAAVLAEKMREAIEKMDVQYKEAKIPVTMTFGISEHSANCTNIENCIQHADMALYAGKQSGRNQVVLYSPEHEDTYLS
ncbi:MAG: diguanylate cyclase [Spirochaetia bacterium]